MSAYQAWSVVFGEQPSAAKWNILGTNDAGFNDGTAIADGVIKPEHLKNGSSALNSWVWDAWTPTWTNLTVGNSVQSSNYIRIGNMVFFRLSLVLGSTGSVGSTVAFSLPVTSVTYPSTSTVQIIGNAGFFDVGVATFQGVAVWATTTTARLKSYNASGSATVVNELASTSPFTWVTGDEIWAQGFYEAAA